jgi:hypothetical protein
MTRLKHPSARRRGTQLRGSVAMQHGRRAHTGDAWRSGALRPSSLLPPTWPPESSLLTQNVYIRRCDSVPAISTARGVAASLSVRGARGRGHGKEVCDL